MRLIYEENHAPALGAFFNAFIEDEVNHRIYFYDSEGSWALVDATGLGAYNPELSIVGQVLSIKDGNSVTIPIQNINGLVPKTTQVNGRPLTGNIVLTPEDLGIIQGGVTDHGQLTGLADDDHPQYFNQVRADIRYGLKSVVDGKADTAYVDAKVASLVDSAPMVLDTLNELAAALGDDPNFATTMTTALGTKANVLDLAPVSFSGSYTDLINKPVLFDGQYASLTGKPTLSVVSATGDYADLINKPALYSNTDGDARYLQLTGGTVTGELVVTSGNLSVDTAKYIRFQGSGNNNWRMGRNIVTTVAGQVITSNRLQIQTTTNAGEGVQIVSTLNGGTSVFEVGAPTTANVFVGTMHGSFIVDNNLSAASISEAGTALSSRYLLLTGGTLTGTLNINNASGSANIAVGTAAASGDVSLIRFGGNRAHVGYDGTMNAAALKGLSGKGVSLLINETESVFSATTTGAVNLNGRGTNQSITLTPSGTGLINLVGDTTITGGINATAFAGSHLFTNSKFSASSGDVVQIIGTGTNNSILRFYDDAIERGLIYSINNSSDFFVRSQVRLGFISNNAGGNAQNAYWDLGAFYSTSTGATIGLSANPWTTGYITDLKITTLQVGTSTTAGYVLTADASGNATWQAPTGSGGGISQATADTLYVSLTATQTVAGAKTFSGALTANGGITLANNMTANATSIITDTTTGLKIGTSTAQKIGLFNATPVTQPGAGTDLGVAMSALGLRGAGTAYTLITSGAVTLTGAVTIDSTNINITRPITQTHAFVVGDIVRRTNGSYVKAIADGSTNGAAGLYIVSAITGTTAFKIRQMGSYVGGLTGLVDGTLYYLSPTTAGTLTSTAPTVAGQVAAPIFVADSTTSGFFGNYLTASVSGATTAQNNGTSENYTNSMFVTNRQNLRGNVTPASGEGYVYGFTPKQTLTASKVGIGTGATGGSGLTLARVGIYSVNESTGAMTLVASTASNTTGLTSAYNAVQIPLSAAYTFQAGVRYIVMVLIVGTTPPQLSAAAGSDDYSNNGFYAGFWPRLCGKVTGLTDLPATQADSGVTATGNGVNVLFLA